MAQLVDQYPYLFSLLICLIIYGGMMAAFPSERHLMLIGSVLSLPHAFFAIELVPSYWQPELIFTVFGVGLEDFGFMFVVGGWVWIAATWPARKRLRLCIQRDLVVRRYLVGNLLGMSLCFLLLSFGVRGYQNVFLSMAAVGFFVLLMRKDLVALSFSAAVSFAILYILFFKLVLFIWPSFTSLWTWENLWGVSVFNIPFEELLWALLYPFTWAAWLAYIFDVTITKPVQRKAKTEVTARFRN